LKNQLSTTDVAAPAVCLATARVFGQRAIASLACSMKRSLSVIALLALSACGGGGDATTSSTPAPVTPVTVPVSGTVSAPSAAIAFRQPGALEQLLAGLFGKAAYALVPGSSAVGAGVTVNLIEIDSSGNQVGNVIATTTTNVSGGYTLAAPEGFQPASKYVVRVVGNTTTMDAIVTSTQVDVDPYTNASRVLITGALTASGASLSTVNLQSIQAVQQMVVELAKDVPVLSTASQLTTALQTQAQQSEESNNIVTSIASSGTITGKVTDSANAGLPNIKVVVRKFGNQVVQAVTLTDANGNYSVHVPIGDYVVGALNLTTSSFAASEWYTSAGGSTVSFSADKVTIADTTPLTRDFVLAAGGRIAGTVKSGTTPVAGIVVSIRDYSSDEFIATSRTGADGSYASNLPAGVYRVAVSNRTLEQALAAQSSVKATVTAGTTFTGDFSLVAAKQISGTVLASVNGTPVPGVPVRFYDGTTDSFVEAIRSDSTGAYRLWLAPASYTVRSRGQTATVDVSTSSQTKVFDAPVGTITATIQDSASRPLSEAKLRMFDNTGANLLSFEVSNGDGTVTLYSTAAANNLLELKIDNGMAVGSSIYSGKTQLLTGTQIAAPAPGATVSLGTITMLPGVVLSGTVTKAGTPVDGAVVQVRSGGLGGNARFVSTRTSSDGTYTLSLPAGTYNRVCAFDFGTTCPNTTATGATYKFVDGIVLTAGTPKTQDFAY
jgi:hypothetical protein